MREVDDLLAWLFQEGEKDERGDRQYGAVWIAILARWIQTDRDHQVHVRALLLDGLLMAKEPKHTAEGIRNMWKSASPTKQRYVPGKPLAICVALRKFGAILQHVIDSATTKEEGGRKARKMVEDQADEYTEMLGTTSDGAGPKTEYSSS